MIFIGPCVGIDNTQTWDSANTAYTKYSAVYCAGSRCDEGLVVSNDVIGVCTEGTIMPHPSIVCSKTYYKCLTDKATSLQYWQSQSCPDDHVFSRRSYQCNTTCKQETFNK